MRIRTTGFGMGIALGLLLATSAHAMYVLDNPFEEKCAAGMSKGLAKFTGAKAKCLTKCQQGARKALNPVSDCSPPYAGATAGCIADPLKGAEAKASAAILKGCLADCPECYAPDCGTFISNRVSQTETQLDVFGAIIWCDDSGSGDGLTAGEAKCMDNTAKVLAKFSAAKSKCYDKCLGNEFKGKLPQYSCLPPSPADALTQTCISLAESKAIAGIDKLCSTVGEVPECSIFTNGSQWVSQAESAIDSNIPITYCGSPSGAFVE